MANDADIAAAAESIRRLLEFIDAGEVEAAAEERRRLEGALAALVELLGRRAPVGPATHSTERA